MAQSNIIELELLMLAQKVNTVFYGEHQGGLKWGWNPRKEFSSLQW